MAEFISCPSCKSAIALTDILRDQVELATRARLEAELPSRIAAASQQARAEVEAHLAGVTAELRAMQQRTTQLNQREVASAERESELLRRDRDLDTRARAIALEVEQRASSRENELRDEMRREFETSGKQTIVVLEQELERARKGAIESAAQQAELMARTRELEEREGRAAVEIEQQVTRRVAELREAATTREVELAKRAALIDAREAQLELQMEQRLASERLQLREKAEADARARLELTLKAEREQNECRIVEATTRAEILAQEQVLALQRERELQSRLQAASLEAEKRIAEEIKTAAARQQLVVDERLQLMQQTHEHALEEQRVKFGQLQRTAEELQRKLVQGSQQLQGEAQEIALRDVLVRAWDTDQIEDVATGTVGADLLHFVRDAAGGEAGTIVWESKRTRQWNESWLPKLRDQLREVGGALGVIVTQTLPAGITQFGQRDGIWVCSWSVVVPLAAALRATLLDVAMARRFSAGASNNRHALFEYTTGPEFRNRVSGVVEAFTELQEELQRERRAMNRIWNRRSKQLERGMRNLGSLWGDLQGIVGKQLETPDAFELAAGDPDDDDEDLSARGAAGGSSEIRAIAKEILRQLDPDGASCGNGTLREGIGRELLVDLEADEGRELYDAAVELLVSAGKVRRGKGRGGSLARVEDEGRGSDGVDAVDAAE